MGSRKTIFEKQSHSSKRNQVKDYFLEGTPSRKNPYSLKSVEQQMKKKMQRIVHGELDEMEDDDLYEDVAYAGKRKRVGMKGTHLGAKNVSKYEGLEG